MDLKNLMKCLLASDKLIIFFRIIIHQSLPDISDTRLAVAKSMGATHTLKVSGEPNDVARVVRSVLGSPPRVSVECSGAESSVKTAIYVCTVCVCMCA